MTRTESKTFTVRPSEEHNAIERMQVFGWSLLTVQEIRTQDTRLEERSAGIFTDAKDLYSVTTFAHYLRVTFSRGLDEPNLATLRDLERKYMNLRYSQRPFSFTGAHWFWGGIVLGVCLFGIPTLLMAILHFAVYAPQRKAWEDECLMIESQRREIVNEAKKY